MAETATKSSPKTDTKPDVDQPRRWNVVLIDDNDHSYEYVMRMMQDLFRHPLEKAFQIAQTVDSQGRAVCLTTHKEHAELKRDQIHGFGADPMLARSKGAMTAVIEPAEEGGDGEGEEGGEGKK